MSMEFYPVRADIFATKYKPVGGGAVRERRQAGDSWRAIAEDVSLSAGVTVSYETLRTWFGGA